MSTLRDYGGRTRDIDIDNIFHLSQTHHLMVKSYIPGVDYSISANRCYNNHFNEKIINTLYYWIDNHPHTIPSTNASESVFIKHCFFFKKQIHLLQM